MSIPVVIIHRSYKEYLKRNIEITGKCNKIFLIGDNSVEKLGTIKNVQFININKYESLFTIKEANQNFVNYSSNPRQFEWYCFERMFILDAFMKDFKLECVFHIDSDNVLFEDINTYPFTKNIAYCIVKQYHQYRMSCSVHSGLLNQEFTEKFIELFNDIYVNKSKFHLIQDKINYHLENGIFKRGGICDMTLYHIMEAQKIVDVQNLLIPTKGLVFVNNINNGEGPESKEQYSVDKENRIQIQKCDNSYMIYDKIHNKRMKVFNMHFQGTAKSLLLNFSS